MATPYYDHAGITIYHGDCREVLPMIGSASVGLLLTDPPYGINLDSSWLSSLNVQRGKPANASDELIIGDESAPDLSILWVFPRRMIWGFPYLVDPDATGWIVWDKQPGVARRGITTPVEMASTTCRKGFDIYRCMWGGYMRPTGEIRFAHPTQKPRKIFEIPINDWSKPGDLIIDPFMGSGTALRAAKDLGRRAIGIEIKEEYCEIAVKRLAQETLFGIGG